VDHAGEFEEESFIQGGSGMGQEMADEEVNHETGPGQNHPL
jgi:hypothetical protein